MDQQAIKQELSGLPIGPVRFFPSIGSTNDEAARWAARGAPDLSLVIADEQTAGRGRLNRRWFTPPGAALAFSLILRPRPSHLPAPENPLMHLTALGALGVCEALRLGWGLPAQVKWPNDVLLGGRKTAGILVELHWLGGNLSTAILGIGVNVSPAAVPPDEEVIYPATSVETVLGRPVDRLALLHDILARLLEWRDPVGSAGFLQAWEERLALRGEWVQVVSTGQGEAAVLEGQVDGLESDGALRLVDRQGRSFTIRTGDVRLRPQDG